MGKCSAGFWGDAPKPRGLQYNPTDGSLHSSGNDKEDRNLIVMSGSMLSASDEDRLVGILSENDKIETLSIKGGELYFHSSFEKALINHPGLHVLDLHNTGLYNYKNFKNVLDNKRIQKISLPTAKPDALESFRHYEELLEAIASTDHLAVINFWPHPCAPLPEGCFWSAQKLFDYFSSKTFKNLCEGGLYGQQGYEIYAHLNKEEKSRYSSCFSDLTKENKAAATALYEKVIARDLASLHDFTALRERLPAILCLASQEGEKQRLSVLCALDELSHKHGRCLGMGAFCNEEEKKILRPLRQEAVVVLPSVDEKEEFPALPSLDELALRFKPLDRDALSQRIEAGRKDPALLMTLGEEQVDLFAQAALSSLQAAPDAMGVGETLAKLSRFLELYTAAREVVSRVAERAMGEAQSLGLETKGLEKRRGQRALPAEPNGVFAFLKRLVFRRGNLDGPAREGHELVQAGKAAGEAGRILSALLPDLGAIETRLSGRFSENHRAVVFYNDLVGQIAEVRSIAAPHLEAWNKSDRAENEAFVRECLAARLDDLERVEAQAVFSATQKEVTRRSGQEQARAFGLMRTHSIPLLAARVSDFIENIGDMQRSALISGVAAATREATRAPLDEAALAALKSSASIEELAASLTEALEQISAPTTKAIEAQSKRPALKAGVAQEQKKKGHG